MKKLFIIAIIAFFTIQTSASSLWFGHDDFVRVDDEADDDGNYPSTNVRRISVYFTSKKPDQDAENSKNKIKFTSIAIFEAGDKIKSLLGSTHYKELDFYEIKESSHSLLIKDILNDFYLENGEYTINFHNDIDNITKISLEEFCQQKRKNYESFLEAQYEKKQRNIEEIEEFSESQGAGDAMIMQSMGYLPDDD